MIIRIKKEDKKFAKLNKNIPNYIEQVSGFTLTPSKDGWDKVEYFKLKNNG